MEFPKRKDVILQWIIKKMIKELDLLQQDEKKEHVKVVHNKK